MSDSYYSLPKSCKNRISESEFGFQWAMIKKHIDDEKTEETYRHKTDVEEFVIHEFNYKKLTKTLLSLIPFQFQPYTLYRIISDKKRNFMLVHFCKDVTVKENEYITIPDMDQKLNEFKEEDNPHIKFDHQQDEKEFVLEITNINTSKNTIIHNLVETFERHELMPEYIELWHMKSKDRKIKSVFITEIAFEGVMQTDTIDSIKNDLERYMHIYIKPMSVFDLLGPAMVGPSSSHTAGANKIGQLARKIILAKAKADDSVIEGIEIKLLGSFRDTGPGHRTPAAIGGGLWGFPTDHQDMLAHGDPDFLVENGFDLGDFIPKFLGYIRGSFNDDEKYKKEHNNNMVEVIVHTNKNNFTITGFSIGGGNVEIRYINNRLSDPVTGKETLYLYGDQVLTAGAAKQHGELPEISSLEESNCRKKSKAPMPFHSFEEMGEYVSDTNKSLIDIIIDIETKMQGSTKENIYEQTRVYWEIMKASVKKGVQSSEFSILKLSGKDAKIINDYVGQSKLFNNVFGKAIAYSIAVSEINAKSGVIVACPTAGSCGILPGVLNAFTEFQEVPEKKILESMLVAGFLGMILFNDVTTAGADYGCQAEIGAGAAMAAAAVTYLENGNIDQIIHSFILALKNALGLICDPVAGLVEVPCVKRNGIYASAALSASMLALSGVRSYISPDEVVMTMKEVGDKLHKDYKETAGGGLAKTRDGKAVDRAFQTEVSRFFGK
jgi:L-serine dehydratase